MTRLIDRVRRKLLAVARKYYVAYKFERVRGARSTRLRPDEFNVVCMVKDGEAFLPSFISHYQQLGASKIVLIDNGSTDATVALASQHPDVIIVTCRLPAKHYESDMRSYAARRFCSNGWCLFADVDEFFEYPGMRVVRMKDFLDYLVSNEYTAVVGRMMDMYSNLPLSAVVAAERAAGFAAVHIYHETESEIAVEYYDQRVDFHHLLLPNVIPDEGVYIAYGGVRLRVFGSQQICLTKHPLVRMVRGVRPSTHAHCSSAVRCADVTAVLRHYKFACDFISRTRKEVMANAWGHGAGESYLKRLDSTATLYSSAFSRPYTSVDDLVKQGYVFASNRYLALIGKMPNIPS